MAQQSFRNIQHNIAKRLAAVRLRTGAMVLGGLLVVFIFVNFISYCLFLHRTYPNTQVASYSIGATDYRSLAQKINGLPILPSSISLTGRGHNFSIPPAQLGIQLNDAQITVAAQSRSWLPIENFITAHKVPVSLQVNQTSLTKKLQALASIDKQAATNAQISLQNNQFVLVSSTDGYQLNVAQASSLITKTMRQNGVTIKLPFSSVAPTVTDNKLEPTLQQLRAQQGIFLNYTYNGTSTRPSAATIASWYSLVNNQYVIQSSKIQAYIVQAGATDGIHVSNLNALVSQTETAVQKASSKTFALTAVPITICTPNTKNQLIVVSITQQHMWACSTYNEVYDSPVVTGMENLPADLTPTGTYKIKAKETKLYLNGSDSTGSWHDFVNYWMPFLTNQYGVYGFHDATWRANSDFGNISPESSDASHGCVELPLATAQWLYNWVSIGATVTITK